MERFLALLLASALGGAAGGFLVHTFAPGAPRPNEIGVMGDASGASIAERLAAIERRLVDGGMESASDAPSLRSSGRASSVPGVLSGQPTIDTTTMERLAAGVAEKLSQQMKDSVQEALRAERDREAEDDEPARPAPRRVTLADAARELDLDAAQEQALRDLYTEIENDAYRLVAGEDGDPEEVRRDVQGAKSDPTKRMQVVGKYLPKVINNIGGVMELDAKRRARTAEIVGPEKADRLNNGEFLIEEQNPLGWEGAFRVGMRR